MTYQYQLPILCVLTSMSTPPNILLEGTSYFSLYPIDRTNCPDINPRRDIIFELFTTNNPNTSQQLLLSDDKSISNSNLNFSNPTIIHFHGFLETVSYGSPNLIREVYIKRGGYNIVIVKASVLLAGPWYFTASRNTKVIGKYTASFIDYLVTKGLNLAKVHLIGHSLGSHSAGACGSFVRSGRIPRITGLDPALPLFRFASASSRLDKSDAEFVDVIHTDGGLNGFFEPIGHVDFYPNGGTTIQPGCSLLEIIQKSSTPLTEIIFCSHWKSFMFYAETVLNPNIFNATNTYSWKDFTLGRRGSSITYMGYAVSKNARGNYYLRTNSN